MQTNHVRDSTHEDAWIEHPHGRIFTRTWLPLKDRESAATSSPIVLFHDSLGCVDLWRNFPAMLSVSTGRRVIAYDRLGYGRSDPRSAKPGLDFIAEEAHTYFPAVCAQLDITRFIAFGHSVGGGIAIYCAAKFPGACEGLITESAQAFVDDRILHGIQVAKESFKQPGQITRLMKYHGDKATWVLNAWTDTWSDPDFSGWSLKNVLPEVTCPLLVIHGAQDEYGSLRHPETIAGLSGGPLRVEIMPDTYHVPHREHEETIIELARDFIGSIKYILPDDGLDAIG
ncbi:alpha/beta hydrolase [Janthinobacterium sp. 17J80-10]|uniref:alpha/beta fold hydrolase n=1 Tax=Janthinobacterium sp. 17J80-10 TaxID=2497863 RepID=UPI0010059C8E|nr:alpha/beta hydrolase [Janthinobacterium sp. 17J80-10]QAU33162.1 alpha/beta hydrolase [Janthinobacterium sp. 17J80-10]